jgi:hypothetical protein
LQRSLIARYHKGGDVSYSISDLEVDEEGQGYMIVDYTIHIYSGCRDMVLDEESDLTVNIAIDLESGEALLTGEEIPEREPDNY